jgi:hypothetical protein
MNEPKQSIRSLTLMAAFSVDGLGTWAIEQQARGDRSPTPPEALNVGMLRRYTASHDAEKAAQAHASFSPGDRL